MLSAAKVKLHGMKDDKWTIKDKVTQYKSLVNLYARDCVIVERDTHVTRRRQLQNLLRMRKEVLERRRELDNAMRGDAQTLRNTLASHPDVKRAFQEHPPTRVVEHVKQLNHVKRREMDRLRHRRQQKTEELIRWKLEHAELEDRLKYDTLGDLPDEVRARIILGDLQDTLLKKEVAASVRVNFNKILEVMRMDALYFDAVLDALRRDGERQGGCILRAAQLGQLAVEYVDDRRREYAALERNVMGSMKERQRSLDLVHARTRMLAHDMRTLVRRDSDINVHKRLTSTRSEIGLQDDLFELDTVLKYVSNVCYVSAYIDIVPRMQDQNQQTEKLVELSNLCRDRVTALLQKKEHAEVTYRKLQHASEPDSTAVFAYRKQKETLLASHDAQKARVDAANALEDVCGARIVALRSALQQLLDALVCVEIEAPPAPPPPPPAPHKREYDEDVDDEEEHVAEEELVEGDDAVVVKKSKPYMCLDPLPEPLELDAKRVFELISERLQALTKAATLKMDAKRRLEAEETFAKLIIDVTRHQYAADFDVEPDVSLLEGMEIEDPAVPSRNEIKSRSRVIVEENTPIDEIALLEAQEAKSKKKGKKK